MGGEKTEKRKKEVIYYLFLCIFPSLFPFGDLPRRHMWGIFHISYIGFSCLYIVLA